MKTELIQCTPNIVQTIARIASICYDSAPKDAWSMAQLLYQSEHHSVFEHVYFTWKIEGISRACSHQLVRHRMCSFTQRSQRYCSEAGFDDVKPLSVSGDSLPTAVWGLAIENMRKAYSDLVRLGVPSEDARGLLPNACETQLYMSCNLRELIHIANERLCNRAQSEIRELVDSMCRDVVAKESELKAWLVPKCEKSSSRVCHFCPESKSCGKHPRIEEIMKEYE